MWEQSADSRKNGDVASGIPPIAPVLATDPGVRHPAEVRRHADVAGGERQSEHAAGLRADSESGRGGDYQESGGRGSAADGDESGRGGDGQESGGRGDQEGAGARHAAGGRAAHKDPAPAACRRRRRHDHRHGHRLHTVS